jgi:predicted MFS family arabinose efflux permease
VDDSTATAGDRPERLVRGYTGRLLLAASLGWTAVQAGRLALSPLLPAITADLGISDFAAGVALSVLWGCYALLQYPSGRLSDRLSRKTLLVSALAFVGVGFGALASATSYAWFLAGAAVVGVGAGLYPTAARALVSDLFVERRGQAFGLHTSSGDLGGVAAAGIATVVLAVAVWRAAFVPVVVVLAAVAVALHAWSREPYVLARPDLAARATARRLLGSRDIRWLVVAYVLYAFSWQAAVGFLPTYFQVGKGFSAGVANAGFAALFVVGMVVKTLAGGLSDYVPRDRLAPAALAVAAVGLGAVVLSESAVAATAGVVTFAAGLMAFPPVMQAHLMDVFPAESAGGDLGATRTVYIGLGAVGPAYVGGVADLASYDMAFAGVVACLLASAGVAAWRSG